MLTIANLNAILDAFRQLADVRESSGLLCEVPIFHVIGLTAVCHTAVRVGAHLLLSPGFAADNAIARIGDPRCAITRYFTVPQAAQMLLGAPNYSSEAFRSLRALFVEGAALSPELANAWRTRRADHQWVWLERDRNFNSHASR